MTARALIFLLAASLSLMGQGGAAQAGRGFLRAGVSGDGGPYVNLIVRVLEVSPIRAHVGDVIRFEMLIENRGDNYYDTVTADIYADGRRVASKLFTYGLSGYPGRTYRETLAWDTRDAAPGEYRIRGEVFLWYDASPFDNFLEVEQPLVLLPPGASFPGGEEAGGSALAVDPRYTGPPPRADGTAGETDG
jgi:hypothetical protein